MEGVFDGVGVGPELGDTVSTFEGSIDGTPDIDGTSDFKLKGVFDGVGVGPELGDTVSTFVGNIDGTSDFNLEGVFDGVEVGGEMGEFGGDESFPPPQTQHT